ncbi:glycosyltransferase [Algoriphagus sp. Y33]|uniref:glycosyltransferase n=1 Tax=Algoriphagus sp. Y33 TaxID=2772483 RepID=UPI00177E8856|nr:glycosyltransferase [Algoriphagus sp. Y33]
MISIIICSANKPYLDAVKESIAKTIGCEYEILSYENAKGEHGICEIYNQGAAEARYDIVCFMHEDIEYKTQDWGKIVLRTFSENPSLGLLGVAGGDYKSLAPSSWFNFEAPAVFPGNKYVNLIQGFKSVHKEPVLEFCNPKDQKLAEVACVDGLWMCTKKSISTTLKFDEMLLKGFHGYDIDYSIAVGQKYTVGVTFDVLIHHLSEGKFEDLWLLEILKVHKKWSRILPINKVGLDKKEVIRLEKRLFKLFMVRLCEKGWSKKRMIDILWAARKSKIMSLSLFSSLLLFVAKVKKTA